MAPLHYAAIKGQFDIASLLLENQARPRLKNCVRPFTRETNKFLFYRPTLKLKTSLCPCVFTVAPFVVSFSNLQDIRYHQ
jgi:ankyrin repeat protein